jgi:hypothetical protein
VTSVQAGFSGSSLAAMRRVGIAGIAFACALFVCGCLLPQSPTVRAINVEHLQCPDLSPSPTEVVQTTQILHVYGDYFYQSAGLGKIEGARILLRPPEGMTVDRMTRVLQCYGAQGFLGHTRGASTANDPFFLPDAWVDIDVKVENGNYVAVLTSDTSYNNLRILQRANAFAAAQQAARPVPQVVVP